MQRKIIFETGEFYHVFNQGVDRLKIFFVENDKRRFQRLMLVRNTDAKKKINLLECKDKTLREIQAIFQDSPRRLVDVVAYALMDNHFHMLVREKVEGGVTKFMSKLLTSQAMYMNKKYDRTGPLMCKPFRAKHVDSDKYFRWLVSYIHLNPLDLEFSGWKSANSINLKKAQEFLTNYQYSSYVDYFGESRDSGLILNKGVLPINISDIEDVEQMLEEFTTDDVELYETFVQEKTQEQTRKKFKEL